MDCLDARYTYKKPTSVESVDIDADSKAGQVVEPAREMHVSDMLAADTPYSERSDSLIPDPRVAKSLPPGGGARRLM